MTRRRRGDEMRRDERLALRRVGSQAATMSPDERCEETGSEGRHFWEGKLNGELSCASRWRKVWGRGREVALQPHGRESFGRR